MPMPDQPDNITGAHQLSQETVDQLSRAMEQAYRRIKRAESRLYGDWMVVGEGLLAGRRWAQQVAGSAEPRGRAYNTAYSEWLNHYRGIRDLDDAARAVLLKIMEERPAIEQWRASLTEPQRRRLNHPTTVWRKFNARARTPASRPRRNASRIAVEHEQAIARMDELTQEVESLRSREQSTGVDQLVDALIAHIEQSGPSPQLLAGVLRLLASFNQARRRSRQRQVSDALH
jgi:hypothetical protein